MIRTELTRRTGCAYNSTACGVRTACASPPHLLHAVVGPVDPAVSHGTHFFSHTPGVGEVEPVGWRLEGLPGRVIGFEVETP